MMLRIYIYGIVFFLIGFSCKAQSGEIDKKLRSFLNETYDETLSNEYDGKVYYVSNLLNHTNFDSTKNGIYSFGINGTHYRSFIFIYENKKVDIIRDYSVTNILEKLISFFDRNEFLDDNDKVEYLKNLVPILKEIQFPPGYKDVQDTLEIEH